MTVAIEATNLVKRFSTFKRQPGLRGAFRSLFSRTRVHSTAVDDVSFSIGQGEAVGYLGPNGAGKSTTIKMLTGILSPNGGSVRVLGEDPLKRRRHIASQIGVVFGQRSQLWWDLPVEDSFELHQRIYQIERSHFEKHCDSLCEMMELGPLLSKPVRQLSLGQRMRVEITMALLHEPKILFLDEPTIGLDIMAKEAIRDFLSRINREQNVSIILTTHDLQDIESICPRIILIDHGKLLFDGNVDVLKQKLGANRRLKIEFTEDPGQIELPHAQLSKDEGRIKHFRFDREVSPLDALVELKNRHSIKDISLEEPNIEEVIKIYYRNLDTSRKALSKIS